MIIIAFRYVLKRVLKISLNVVLFLRYPTSTGLNIDTCDAVSDHHLQDIQRSEQRGSPDC